VADPHATPATPRRHPARRSEAVTLFDRLAMAFLGVVVGVLTLLGYVLAVTFLAHPRAAPALLALLASPLGMIFVAGCALVGALAPDKLADLFALLWGNHAFWDSRRGRWTAAVVAMALCAGLLLVGDIGPG
jgi:hypothetical protein